MKSHFIKCKECGEKTIEIRHRPHLLGTFAAKTGLVDEDGNMILSCRVCYAADYKAAAEIGGAINKAWR
jgi:ribosomal protein L32